MSAEKLVAQVLDEGASIRIVDGKVRLSAAKPLPNALMVQLREVKDDIYQHLIGSHTEPVVHVVPFEWKKGVECVVKMDCPNNWPNHKWPETQASIKPFFDKWGATATALGWSTLDVFGAHRHAPYHRIASAGLALSSRANEVAVMQHNRATIITPSGARLNYYRRKQHCSDTVPIWEL